MKRLFITTIAFSLLFACAPEDNSNSSSSSTTTTVDNNGDDDGTDTDTDSSGTGGSGSSAGNCSGTSSDGQGDGGAIHQLNLTLAGHQSWMPGTYANAFEQQSNLKIKDSSIIFKSDSRLKIRLKVNSQPFPTAGEEYCYGRAIGQASDPYPYTKLRFRVHLRDILCETPNVQDPSICDSTFKLGDRYRTQIVEPTSVDSCSQVIDLGSMRNQSSYGTTVEIEDVKADSTCQSNDTFCPAEKIVRAASCWHMTMQVVTDFTQDFK